MSGFTPGPWGATEIGETWDVDNEVGVNIATAFSHEVDGEEMQANAHLIAAAPCLLEALEATLNYISNTESELGIELESANLARKAITKARGL